MSNEITRCSLSLTPPMITWTRNGGQNLVHCVQDAAKWGLGRCDNKTVTALLQKFLANHKCPYTGGKLQLGFNTHLDHIQPRHKFSELASNIDKVEWISEKANLAKSGLTKDEFIEFCQQVVKVCGGSSR